MTLYFLTIMVEKHKRALTPLFPPSVKNNSLKNYWIRAWLFNQLLA
jgi:hypothetical protein